MRGYIPSIAFLGDDIAGELAPYLGPEAARQIGGKLRLAVYSKTGTSAKEWVTNSYAEQVTREFRPNLVVVALGTIRGEERDGYEYAGLMQRLATSAQAGGAARVVLVGPFGGDDDGKRNGALREVFRGRAVDGYAVGGALPRAGEGSVRFSAEGYRQLAVRLVRRIVPDAVAVRRPGGSIRGVVFGVGAGALTTAALPFLKR